MIRASTQLHDQQLGALSEMRKNRAARLCRAIRSGREDRVLPVRRV